VIGKPEKKNACMELPTYKWFNKLSNFLFCSFKKKNVKTNIMSIIYFFYALPPDFFAFFCGKLNGAAPKGSSSVGI
jgi:hypothetical protein